MVELDSFTPNLIIINVLNIKLKKNIFYKVNLFYILAIHLFILYYIAVFFF